MPALNGRGPQGQGPRTGRGLGYCSPTGRSTWPNYDRGWLNYGRSLGRSWFGLGRHLGRGWFGRGLGRGFGFGRGWGWPSAGYRTNQPFYQEPTAKEEKELLGEELKGVKEEMKEIEARLEGLSKKK